MMSGVTAEMIRLTQPFVKPRDIARVSAQNHDDTAVPCDFYEGLPAGRQWPTSKVLSTNMVCVEMVVYPIRS